MRLGDLRGEPGAGAVGSLVPRFAARSLRRESRASPPRHPLRGARFVTGR